MNYKEPNNELHRSVSYIINELTEIKNYLERSSYDNRDKEEAYLLSMLSQSKSLAQHLEIMVDSIVEKVKEERRKNKLNEPPGY